MTWNASRYLRFSDHRQRPAADLIARIPTSTPNAILDLGCGPGTVTRLLRERWPEATITGVDSAADMLAKARDHLPDAEFIAADLNRWEAPGTYDLIFSNAALHWLPDHGELFPRLVRWLVPQGVIAVQMPDNFGAASHRSIRELAATEPYAAVLGDARMGAVEVPATYHALLTGLGARVDLWTTEYFQTLRGEDPVLDWLRGTTLVPYLECLGALSAPFLTELSARLRIAYPPGADGTVLFPFRRLFLIATF